MRPVTAAYDQTAGGARTTRLSGHLETLRPYDMVAAPLVAAAGATLAAPGASTARVLSAVLTALVAWAAGLYAADHLTRHDDFTAKPHRPIPSGRLPAATARRCALLGTAVTVAVTCAVNWHGLVFIAAAALGQIGYARRLKDAGWWGDLAVGLSGWTCSVLTAATFTTAWPPPAVWLGGLALGLQGAFSNTLLALADRESDRAVGCRTLAVRVGPGGAVAAMAACAAFTYGLALTVPATLGRPGTPVFHLLAAAGVLLAAGCLALACPAPARRGGRPPRLGPAVEPHLYERLLLPAAFLSAAGRPLPAVAAVLLLACVLAVTPRPMLGAGG
jgi:4-hydroxybenzoate polyprenyltransferase/geranylgeranylglycerol-phosphate geranylgeranyltransferase